MLTELKAQNKGWKIHLQKSPKGRAKRRKLWEIAIKNIFVLIRELAQEVQYPDKSSRRMNKENNSEKKLQGMIHQIERILWKPYIKNKNRTTYGT